MSHSENIRSGFYYFNLVFFSLLSIALLASISVFLGISFSIYSNQIFFDEIGILAWVSLILFIGCCFLGVWSDKYFFLFFFFVLIAFPSTVDNFLPGILLGNKNEVGVNSFPFLTHIDLYLMIGIGKFVYLKNKIASHYSGLFLLAVILIFSSFLINIFYSTDSQDFLLLIAGLYQIRYLILIYILLSLVDIDLYTKELIYGLIFSIFFLLAESTFFTLVNNLDQLTSGSLGANTFGNLIAQITLFFVISFAYIKNRLSRGLILLAIVIGTITFILTETRMSIISICIAFIFTSWFLDEKKQVVKKIIFTSFGVILIFFALSYYKAVPDRYNVFLISKKISFTSFSPDLMKAIKIRPSAETSSIRTRLKLYQTSINMVADNPVWGIGSGRWNYHKLQYGFKENILIDTHNGYLALLSQYGLVAALLLAYLLYFYPFILLNKLKHLRNNFPLINLAVINLGFSICDLSNAGIYKHQVFALLAFNAILLITGYKKYTNSSIS